MKAKVRFRPQRSPYGPTRPWEAKCLDPKCSTDTHAHTWHLGWYHAMGRVAAHRAEKHA